jgi:hypothetical protein
MKGRTVEAIVSVSAAALIATGSPAAAQTCRAQPADCQANQAKQCEMKVALREVSGRCAVTSIDGGTSNLKAHRVRLCTGDTLTWAFDNQCGSDLTVEIGNFRLVPKPGGPPEQGDLVPLGGERMVAVPRGGGAKLSRPVVASRAPRVYKYDIIQRRPGPRRTILDPEIEIHR